MKREIIGFVGKLRRRPESEPFIRPAKTAKQAMLVLSSMQPDAARRKKGRSKPDRVFRHSLVLVTLLGAALLASDAVRGDTPQGTIAFSSLAPRDWDLYLHTMGGDASALTRHRALDFNAAFSPNDRKIAFVSERHGNMELYVMNADGSDLARLTDNFASDDHPTWSPDGRRIAFVSTRKPAKAGQAWNGIYVIDADGTHVLRLSPSEAADYSPAWSPQADLIAFASGSGRTGHSDVYLMNADGRERRLLVENGGWPTFIEGGKAIAFHSRRAGDRWDVWRINLDGSELRRLATQASMPRAAAEGRKLAVVTHRGRTQQIAVLDVITGELDVVTEGDTDHWNPTITADGQRVVYHKKTKGPGAPNVELWGRPPNTRLDLLRIAGAFPAFSPDGARLALTALSFGRIDVMKTDGSGRKTIFQGQRRSLFGMSWSESTERVAFSHGVVFGAADVRVNIIAASPDSNESETLTEDSGNNGFPCYSPDGQELVFRSGRDGAKNLYIMSRSGTNVRRLTKGNWTDTMCDWSPTGEWIAFSSNRENDFEIWLIRPDGSGLHKLIGGGGRNNHPHFSPDSKWIVFTSQRAGYSAEEISLPSQPQPYGDLFIVRTDGTGLRRLTHNGFEEGTPAWSARTDIKPSRAGGTTQSDY